MSHTTRRVRWIASGALGAVAVFAVGQLASTWIRYGRVAKPAGPPTLLDRFLPDPEVIERHHTVVEAPIALTYAAARDLDLMRSRVVRAVFRGREVLMRANTIEKRTPTPLIDEIMALGWGVLAEEPGREMVFGAVTQPWKADVRFQSLPPEEFAPFADPGFAKIAWTIRVESLGPTTSRFSTETRVATTDADARRRFRRYWTMVSPGVRLIRQESLRLVRSEAERHYQQATALVGAAAP